MQRSSPDQVAIGVVAVCMLLASTGAWSQVAPNSASTSREVSFREYLDAVEQNNLSLQAQRETITSAKAGVSIAGVSPDPLFTAGIASYELNSANRTSASTQTIVGLALTIETAGKRGARVRSAESNVGLTEANVDLFRRQLYADSAAGFVEACRTRAALARKESSLKAMRDIVRANEVRFNSGAIGRLELTQSRVEADRFATDVVVARGDATSAELGLSIPLGKRYAELFPGGELGCDLRRKALSEDLEALIGQAMENRDDVRVAKAAVDLAQKNLSLAQANRWVDPIVSAGVTNIPRVNPTFDAAGNVTNFPANQSNPLGVAVTIPIPFSRLQRGELVQAESAVTQAQLQLQSTLLRAETEVRVTYTQYLAAAQNVQDYVARVLADSDRVLDGVRTSYRLGAASLLELLNAQRTADDVYLGYRQAVADLSNAIVRLQLSTGVRPDL